MKFNNAHKAFAITLLIAVSVVLSVFNIHIIKQNEAIAETLIDITPPDLFEDETQENIEQKDNSQKTNKGYNETKKYKHFAQAFKPIAPPKDYDDPRLKNRTESTSEDKEISKIEGHSSINNEELTSFESVNSILNKRRQATHQSSTEASANKNSSILYSLLGRTDTFLPIPIYLCEADGKIVVNITVNNNGKVVSASINSSSTSSNECLQNHALEYANAAHFDTSSKSSQIGTITFNFEGKH